MWLLLIYELSTTTVKAMERKASGYLRRWLRVPLSITSIGLYSNFTKIRIPVPSQGSKMPPGDDFMRLSRGQDCQSRDPEKKRKKVVSKNISGQSRELYLQDITGITSTGRQGVGMSHFQQRSKVSAAMV